MNIYLVYFAAYSIGGGAKDLHQDILISAWTFHGLPELLHCVDDRWVQHGKDGFLKVS